ncbi:Kinesin light chain [Aspergillus sp. HF37]|nr:Kinesin light chain [Aspergillus sp. HF37]
MNSIEFGSNSGSAVGIHNGPTYLFQPPGQPETPPSPLSTVPFPRDPDFVDRGTLLDQVHKKGSSPCSRVGLAGIGGVGKSQLAIEYSYRVRERSPGTWVFWIHANNATRFEESCRDIADRVKIPGRQDPKQNIFKLLRDWLHERDGDWVLIFDNVDDDQFLHQVPPTRQNGPGIDQSATTPERPIWAYFPQSLKGSIIITSRNKRALSSLVEDDDIFTVEPMDEAHAMALFEKKLRPQTDSKAVAELATALEFMPLAIIQAAAYIKKRVPRLSVPQYLEIFQKSDSRKIRLLNHSEGQLRRDRDAENSILVTLQVSFDHILQTRPSAVDLLSLMSFFDRQGIPDFVLREVKETRDDVQNLSARDRDNTSNDNGEDSESESSVVDKFEDDVMVLLDYSLLSITLAKNPPTV